MKDNARLAEDTVQRAQELAEEEKANRPRRSRRRRAGGQSGAVTTAQVHPDVMKVARALPGVRQGWRIIRPIDARTVMVENRSGG